VLFSLLFCVPCSGSIFGSIVGCSSTGLPLCFPSSDGFVSEPPIVVLPSVKAFVSSLPFVNMYIPVDAIAINAIIIAIIIIVFLLL